MNAVVKAAIPLMVLAAIFFISSRAGATPPTPAQLETLHCYDRSVLCIDACNGDVFAEGADLPEATATFYIDQGSNLRILAVEEIGTHCSDNATFTPSVSLSADLNSLTKATSGQAPQKFAPNVAPAPLDFHVVGWLAIGGSASDYKATVSIKRDYLGAPGTDPYKWTEAQASYILRHGRYFIDFGAGLAIVWRGSQTISAAAYRGNPNDLRLVTDVDSPKNAIFTVFLYPGGHRRGTFSPFAGPATLSNIVRDLFVFEVGTELSRQGFLQSVYLGAGIEPISGVNIVVGAANVPITDYQSGSQAGLAVGSSDVSAVTRTANVWRPFLAISASTEIVNSAKAAYNAALGQ